MPPKLPSDIWIQIVERYNLDYEPLSNLASTSKHLRGLAIPALYHTLEFSAHLVSDSEQPDSFLSKLTVTLHRADYLKKSPQLLHHVRKIRFLQWSFFTGTIATQSNRERPGEETSILSSISRHEDAARLWSSAYQAATSLISQSPHVRSISFFSCVITPQLFPAFSSTPLLESLIFSGCHAPNVTQGLPEIPTAIRLQELNFHMWPLRHSVVHPYFPILLRSCITTLTSLVVRCAAIPLVLSAAANGCVGLRKLMINDVHSMKEKEASATCCLLVLCPELRTITFTQDSTIDVLAQLPHHALPNLESVTGSPTIMRALLPGRPIHTINFLYSHGHGIGPSTFDPLRLSTALIRNVTVKCLRISLRDLIICLAPVIKHVTHLTILLLDDQSREDVRKEQLNIILDNLAQWAQLRVMKIHGNRDLETSAEQDVMCPIAPRQNPGERGHPSLERFRLLSQFTWIWFHGEGWTLRKLEVEG